jgi:CYTH domain
LIPPLLFGQESCDEEVKLLLLPTQVQVAVQALQASGETHGRVYFYDTPALDLLSKGMILRLREGKEIDLTAKLRPVSGEKMVDPTRSGKGYKCEVDLNDGVENQSFSVQREYSGVRVPETGRELFHLLTAGQKRLIAAAKVEIDWKQVRRVADIQSTIWTAPAKPPFDKLSLELWEWPEGSVLEVSTKGTLDAGQVTYSRLLELAGKDGLTLNSNQHSKTAIALGEIVGSHPH